MRLIVLTSVSRGFASACLPTLAESPDCEIAMVVIAGSENATPWRRLRRKIGKTMRIGPLGAVNGIRMRRWFTLDVADRLGLEPVETIARRHGLRVETTPSINTPRTRELFVEADADLGLSLGNGYIGEAVYAVPRHGMINVHHEVLPDFQGAPSVIWQLHEGSTETGYTIHQIDRNIDTGPVLHQERLPIEFRPTLRETVSTTRARLLEASAAALPTVIADYAKRRDAAKPQGPGRRYTTPTWRQYRELHAQYERLRANPASSNA